MRPAWLIATCFACTPKEDGSGGSDDPSASDADTDADADADADADTDTDGPGGIVACPSLPPAAGAVTAVEPSDDLAAVVAAASAGDVVQLAAGTYDLPEDIVVAVDGLTLRGATGVAADVVIDGKFRPLVGVSIRASDVTVAHLTLRNVFRDGVRVEAAGTSVSGTSIYDVSVEEALGRGFVAVHGTLPADGGTLACSAVRMTDVGRSRLAQCDLVGVDLDGVADWTVDQTTVTGMWCPEDGAATGVRVYNGARDVSLTAVQVHDAAVGFQIGVGEAAGRVWDDAPCGGATAQAFGTVVHNSWSGIFDPLIFTSHGGAVANFLFEAACDLSALHLTGYAASAPAVASIQHRYAATTGSLGNAMVTAGILRTDGSAAALRGNLENVAASNFLDARNGDLHLVPSASIAIDQGVLDFQALVGVDVDGEPRIGPPDVGADEVAP